ncbi:ABC transporter ATP-binding protein [Alloyangia pacifica]|uniref:NitT/TauT family transport system ATP-binding protein n=1 Tax=Alloyangia pacifica TaxID=311180 RepID=A0A1I6QGW9_9RHOB|nr:ABC transporter ATP-binding protein [Alloyangia pacifica]SDF89358.1 NitT/TauT family transport system ATP-binding protein [Alloyangia pacifica]SFS51550.1 NitT/TauT family transport system ATP-binding protein [Alloyangia pacifica]
MTQATPDAIRLDSVSKSFRLDDGNSVTALEGIDLGLREGEFVAVLGPSGCGKSTVLRLIAGLESASTGEVRIEGRAPSQLAAAHRLGVAFQDHALLPWLSVAQNIALPYRVAGTKVDNARVDALIELVGLTGFRDARPSQLSGGMRQRASIARALVLDPDVLLLDEPFGALDAVTRRHMNVELQRIWSTRTLTTLLVTHSVDEAIFLADRIIVMTGRPGRILREVTVPFPRPRDPSVLRTPEFHAMVDELTLALEPEEAAL